MQKICSLLLVVLVGQTMFAGKKEKALVGEPHAYVVIQKYNLMTREPIAEVVKLSEHTSNHQGETIDTCDTCAWRALREKCKQLSLEKEKFARENEELRKLLNQQQQPSSSESSPSSTIAISPTNDGEEQRLLSPDEMHLSTPESKRTKSPVQSIAHHAYYYDYPTHGRMLGLSPGFVDKKHASEVLYLSACSDCP